MMDFNIRPIQSSDYPQVLEIVNKVEAPWESTLEELRQEDESALAEGGVCLHTVACSPSDGAVLGHTVLRGPAPSDKPQSYSLELRVAPEIQKQGIGSALWQQISQEAAPLNPSTLTAWVRECYPDALRFAQKFGFEKRLSSNPWKLNISDVKTADFQPVLDKVKALGIEISTLAEEKQKDSECLAKLHQLRILLDKDVPGMETSPSMSYEAFAREVEAENSLADAFFIARKDSDYLGMSSLILHYTDAKALNQTTTGVRLDYRSLGVATALKCCGMNFAHTHGYTSIHTYMDETNLPMIKLNEKLGFRPGVGVAFMVKTIQP